jgi:hypothetical protein
MNFSSFDDYWRPFLGAPTPTSAFAATLKSTGPLQVGHTQFLLKVRPMSAFCG